ncbi:hypothetical protein MBLNU230_g7051t1 [Neophaeotheca triangularis]
MAEPTTPDAGPNESPPSLPPGWTAQWDAKSRKYYYVQISTGESTWDVPTTPAPQVPTPGGTPANLENPYPAPGSRGLEQRNDGSMTYAPDGQGSDRGFGSDMMHMAMGGNKPHGGQHGGLAGFASSFLGGGGHQQQQQQQQQQQAHSGGSGGLVGSLASGFLGGNKPHAQTQGQSHGSGMGGMFGNFMGSHHGQQQQSGYGYSSSDSTGGTYTGSAPTYQPTHSQSGTPGQQFGYNTPGQQPTYGTQTYAQQPPSQHGGPPGGYGAPQSVQQGQPGGYGQASQQHGAAYAQPQQPSAGAYDPSQYGAFGGNGQQPQGQYSTPPAQHYGQQQGGYQPQGSHGGYGGQQGFGGGYESSAPPANPAWR